ncbi:MAG: OsmC family protein [Thermoplasmata archaeon]
MAKVHIYRTRVEWTGDQGSGTGRYDAYGREHVISAPGKPDLLGSSDPTFRGSPSRWSPEELLVASLSACHMLWYLHLCAIAGIVVTGYTDDSEGTMELGPDGSGRFTEVVLRPRVTIAAADAARAETLHDDAHRMCFIAASVNFPVRHESVARGA